MRHGIKMRGMNPRTNQTAREHDIKVKISKAGDNPDTKARMMNDGSEIIRKVLKGNTGK